MRVRDIEIVHIELKGEVSHIACGWVGCRAPEGACSIAKYKIRTGRTQAGMWQERNMPVCEVHEAEFNGKYMTHLCPLCGKNPVDENSTRMGRFFDKLGQEVHQLLCEWCPTVPR